MADRSAFTAALCIVQHMKQTYDLYMPRGEWCAGYAQPVASNLANITEIRVGVFGPGIQLTGLDRELFQSCLWVVSIFKFANQIQFT
jgi:hypothetical protein